MITEILLGSSISMLRLTIGLELYGMIVEKAYEEDSFDLEEDIQGFNSIGDQEKRISVIQKDLDKLTLYL
jgi:hypothetical protein